MHETKQTLNNYKASVNFLNEILPVPLSHKRGMLIIISGQDSQHFVAAWTELQKKPFQIKKTSTSLPKCSFIAVCMFPCEKHFGLCRGRLWLWPHRAPSSQNWPILTLQPLPFSSDSVSTPTTLMGILMIKILLFQHLSINARKWLICAVNCVWTAWILTFHTQNGI